MVEPVLFSDSWHLVARQCPALRPDLRTHRQVYRGEIWRVLGDPMHNDWFRVRAEAWRFLTRLDGATTVDEAWRHVLDTAPESAPGQQEVVQLLAQLHGAGLLRGDLPPDGAAMFRRLQERRRREVRSQWSNFLFLRFPLWDPQRALALLTPLIRGLFSTFGGVLWLSLVVMGLAAVAGDAGRFADQTQSLLAPGNLLWLYAGWTGLKLLHELAHGLAVRRSGGEVHVMGVMLLVFTPVPFVDASAAWGFRRRRERMLVGAAGMLSDLAVAAIAALIWAHTGTGVVNAVAHNLVVLGSVATLGFNGNPLLRFDGYYLLGDLLEQPNLAARAQQQLRSWLERTLWRRRGVAPVGRTPREGFWLGVYATVSLSYRLVLMTVIVGFVAGQLFEVGLLLAVVVLGLWIVAPVVRFAGYLARGPELSRCRSRAVGVTLGATLAGLLLVGWVPMPRHFRAPGVVRASAAATVVAGTDGQIERVWVESGAWVEAGQVLVEMTNSELVAQQARLTAMEAEVAVRQGWARDRQPGQLAPLRARAALLDRQRVELEARRKALQVRAPHAGRWLAPYAADYAGVWVARGTELGAVVGDRTVYFSTVVAQSAAADLFRGQLRGGEVWLPGWGGSPLVGGVPHVVPIDRSTLPTASLGWLAGGEVRVTEEGSGRTTTEPFYEVRLPLAASAATRHLREGTARFDLPPEPWAAQGWRALRQVLQRRYQL